MRLTTYVVATVCATVVATAASESKNSLLKDAIPYLPSCALPCFGSALADTTCTLTDEACLCSDQNLFTNITTCVLEKCTREQGLQVRSLTAKGCNEPVRNKHSTFIAVCNTLGITAGVFIIQRFAFKIWVKRHIGVDDWFALATILTGVPSTVINNYGVGVNGMGYDAWTLTTEQLYRFGKYFWVLEWMYFLQIAMVKLSILVFYLCIFPGNGVRRILWITVGLVVAYATAYIGPAIFACAPISYFWTKWDQQHAGTCINLNAMIYSHAGVGIALDLWMLAIPLWQLRGLNLHWKKKVSVAIMFFLGTFVTIVSILRLQSVVEFGSESLNPTWDYVDVTIWSLVEVDVGICCICLPTLRLFLVHLFPSLKGSTARSYGGRSFGKSNASNKNAPNGDNNKPPLGYSASAVHDQDRTSHLDLEGQSITYGKTYNVDVRDADDVALVTLHNNGSQARLV